MLYAGVYHLDPIMLGQKRIVLQHDVDHAQLTWVWTTVEQWSRQQAYTS
jgi:hypothetical protein